MVKLDDLPEWMSHPAVAAALGSALGLKAIPGASIVEKLLNLVAGWAAAVYGGLALIDYMGLSSRPIGAFMIFGVGATGLVVFNAIIEAIKRTDLAAWVLGWLPGKKGGQ